MNEMEVRCCKTCKHLTPLGASISYHCAGCLKDGECTKWEDAGGTEHDE